MKNLSLVFLSTLLFSLTLLACGMNRTQPEQREPFIDGDVPPVRVISFIPADMEPFEHTEERLGRVMTHVQDFFRNGMEANGFGPKTFALEWAEPGRLQVYFVRGQRNQLEYGRTDWFVVRDEVREAIQNQYGWDINDEHIIIFQSLLRWENGRAIELGPFVGGGSALSGTAWVYDDPLLDAALLSSREPGGYYHRPVSIGQFNTHYIGGVAHELGHAFGLPHDRETDEQRRTIGASLMNDGNHHYGNEYRNQGLGTFLSAASALPLTTVRAFVGDLPNSREPATWALSDLAAAYQNRTITLTGRVTAASPELVGIIAFNDDPSLAGGGHGARAWTTTPDAEGNFRFVITELRPSNYQLRLVGVHTGGQKSRFYVDYVVGVDGTDLNSRLLR